jgi:hypothetical protein
MSSISDIYLLVSLGGAVTKRLHSAEATAPQEVRRLILEVGYLQATLFLTRSMLEDHGAVLKQFDDLKDGILRVFERCEGTLRDLDFVAKEFERIRVDNQGIKTLGKDTKGSWEQAFKNYYITGTKWATMDDAINHIRQLLAEDFTALQLTMQSLKTFVLAHTLLPPQSHGKDGT